MRRARLTKLAQSLNKNNMQIIKLKKTNSTKDYITKRINKLSRQREDTVVTSRSITPGKGVFSKVNPTSLGGVHFSYLRFYTGVKGQGEAQIKTLVCHAIINTLYSVGVKAEIKENKVLVGNRQVGDVDIQIALIGDYLNYVVVTVSLNANNNLQNCQSAPFITIKQITGKDVDIESLIFTLYYNLSNT